MHSSDPFEVELGRVARVWPKGASPTTEAVLRTLTQQLADAHADAARLPRAPVPHLPTPLLAVALRAVHADAVAEGVDVEQFAPALAELRRAL